MCVSGVHGPFEERKDTSILSAGTSQNGGRHLSSEAADILPRFLKAPTLSKPITGPE